MNTLKKLDSLVLFLAFIMPFSMLPQIFKMHITQSVNDVSILMYFSLFILTLPWVVYGLVHKEKVLIINNIVWVLIHLTVIISYYIYI